eukprot:jgi/Chlat1/186/Chrsp1S03261
MIRRGQPANTGNICTTRLMQYMHTQRERPPDNNIEFWRTFVREFFAPGATKRWCVSARIVSCLLLATRSSPKAKLLCLHHANLHSYRHLLAMVVACQSKCMRIPRLLTLGWYLSLCRTPGETHVDVLPRLFKVKYDSGVREEIMFLEMCNEIIPRPGVLALECQRVVMESVLDSLRVVRYGQLRVFFTMQLKILSWEFCAQSHEELIPRRHLFQEINQLVHLAFSDQGNPNANTVSQLQLKCQATAAIAQQLAAKMDVSTVNDLGFTKRYVRCLQISDVVNSMKDLMSFNQEHQYGPVERAWRPAAGVATSSNHTG